MNSPAKPKFKPPTMPPKVKAKAVKASAPTKVAAKPRLKQPTALLPDLGKVGARAVSLSPPDSRFPIVGIGASAGGLEALEQFLSGVPIDSGMAFCIVQHLDPERRGMLCELLQRKTPLPVQEITERLSVQPNHVYVIPPGFDISLLHGVLHLLEPAEPRGLRLPIDFFLRSLALDQGEHSVGVILSGMGSDGTLGLRAIKEQAGAAFVQSPSSAKFDGMPRSAINAGLADVVAPAQELAGKVFAYLQYRPLLEIPKSGLERDGADLSGLEKVVLLLRAKSGHDFSRYKKSTIYRRIERRMALHQLTKIDDYVRYLRANPSEAELLFKEMLIGVTNFRRASSKLSPHSCNHQLFFYPHHIRRDDRLAFRVEGHGANR